MDFYAIPSDVDRWAMPISFAPVLIEPMLANGAGQIQNVCQKQTPLFPPLQGKSIISQKRYRKEE